MKAELPWRQYVSSSLRNYVGQIPTFNFCCFNHLITSYSVIANLSLAKTVTKTALLVVKVTKAQILDVFSNTTVEFASRAR